MSEGAFLNGKIKGVVASIGIQGSLITDISNEDVAEVPRDESVNVVFGDHQTIGLFETGHEQPDATMVASLGESGFVEIEIVGISLSDMLGIKPGEEVQITW